MAIRHDELISAGRVSSGGNVTADKVLMATTPSLQPFRPVSPDAPPRRTSLVLSAPIDAVDWDTALNRIESWIARREGRYVCICNAHSVVTASRDAEFLAVLQSADMVAPDGMPVAWMLRKTGHPLQQRIDGPSMMLRLCARAVPKGDRVFLLGSRAETLDLLQSELLRRYPGLQICGAHSPPFRPLSETEDASLVAELNGSNADIIFVSLGCPKQERWMRDHRSRVNAVMIGVGAAFDFHAGLVKRAPEWMQRNGLEWLFRLASEPRRLWRRYLQTNSLFIWGAAMQLWRRNARK